MRDAIPDYLFLLAIMLPIVFLDQLTKWLVRTNIAFGEHWAPWDWLLPYARIVSWKNTGAAFGLFQNGGLIFTILGIVVALGIINYYPIIPRTDKYLRIALALQLAGALGNLTDRLTIGHVVDFLSIWRFPVFNVADASITFGLLFLLLPNLPPILEEFREANVGMRARQINSRFRSVAFPAASTQKSDDPFPLGMLEWIFRDSSWMQDYTVKQRLRQLRQRPANKLHSGSSSGARPRRARQY